MSSSSAYLSRARNAGIFVATQDGCRSSRQPGQQLRKIDRSGQSVYPGSAQRQTARRSADSSRPAVFDAGQMLVFGSGGGVRGGGKRVSEVPARSRPARRARPYPQPNLACCRRKVARRPVDHRAYAAGVRVCCPAHQGHRLRRECSPNLLPLKAPSAGILPVRWRQVEAVEFAGWPRGGAPPQVALRDRKPAAGALVIGAPAPAGFMNWRLPSPPGATASRRDLYGPE